MAVKVVGKVMGFSENTAIKTTDFGLNDVQNQKKDAAPKETDQLAKKTANEIANEPPKESEKEKYQSENKEIAFFSDPKAVKRKTQRHIFGFQAVTAAAVCLIMLLLHLCAPELYENLHLYYLRLFQW